MLIIFVFSYLSIRSRQNQTPNTRRKKCKTWPGELFQIFIYLNEIFFLKTFHSFKLKYQPTIIFNQHLFRKIHFQSPLSEKGKSSKLSHWCFSKNEIAKNHRRWRTRNHLSSGQCTVPKVIENNGQIEQFGLQFASSSTILSRSNP